MGEERDDPQSLKKAAAAAYDYENDPRWADYWSNILIPPHMASRPDVVDHYKRKFFQRYIVGSLPFDYSRFGYLRFSSILNSVVGNRFWGSFVFLGLFGCQVLCCLEFNSFCENFIRLSLILLYGMIVQISSGIFSYEFWDFMYTGSWS